MRAYSEWSTRTPEPSRTLRKSPYTRIGRGISCTATSTDFRSKRMGPCRCSTNAVHSVSPRGRFRLERLVPPDLVDGGLDLIKYNA